MLSEETSLELFDLALQCRKAKLWKHFDQRQLFALALPGGETGYCCAMDRGEGEAGLALYAGQEGVSTYYDLIDMMNSTDRPERSYFNLLVCIGQRCCQCLYENTDERWPDEVEEAKRLAKMRGVRLTRPCRFPVFEKYVPMCNTRPMEDEEDAERMKLLLRACLWLRDHMDADRSFSLPAARPGIQVPLLTETEEGAFTLSAAVLPPRLEFPIPVPEPLDEITVRRLKMCPGTGTWQGGMFCYGNLSGGDDPLKFPCGPVVLSERSGHLVPVFPRDDLDEGLDFLYREFVEALIDRNIRPSRLRVHSYDRRGRGFFGTLAAQLKIPIETADSLPELGSMLIMVEASDFMQFSPDLVDELIYGACATILETPLQDLQFMPSEMLELFFALGDSDCPPVTPEVREKLRRLDRLLE